MKMISGTLVTLELMLAALVVGLILSLLMTLIYQSKSRYLKLPVDLFIFVMRGTPMLLQFFIIYYGSAQFQWIKASPLWFILKEPFACAVIALALNTSAYTTVLFKGAINSVPKGEKEVCRALGFSHFQAMRHIILPRALRIALPAYSNEVIMILKGTSLASTITLLELTGVTRQIASQTYQFIETFLMAGLIYFAINLVIIGLFKLLERKLAFASR